MITDATAAASRYRKKVGLGKWVANSLWCILMEQNAETVDAWLKSFYHVLAVASPVQWQRSLAPVWQPGLGSILWGDNLSFLKHNNHS